MFYNKSTFGSTELCSMLSVKIEIVLTTMFLLFKNVFYFIQIANVIIVLILGEQFVLLWLLIQTGLRIWNAGMKTVNQAHSDIGPSATFP